MTLKPLNLLLTVTQGSFGLLSAYATGCKNAAVRVHRWCGAQTLTIGSPAGCLSRGDQDGKAILLHCRDDQVGPVLGTPRNGRKPEDFLRNAYLDIPTVVEALRQHWMPIRYARDR
ncbi:hypothetical protein [Bradyrhizobium sp. USDA 336]|uniref:hypothetical protein n=1 Tax=Bradyrhizobium sp. USDA 336 TaxID=3156311 RepID=UPI003834C6D5